MVYIKHWPQFQAQCLELYQKSPEKARYLIKASPSQTFLILKVTDDTTCLKFKARSSIILNRFESFTRDLTASMAGLPLPSSIAAAAGAKDVEMKDDTKAIPSTQAQGNNNSSTKGSTGQAAGGGQTSGGAKKKKGKKGGKK